MNDCTQSPPPRRLRPCGLGWDGLAKRVAVTLCALAATVTAPPAHAVPSGAISGVAHGSSRPAAERLACSQDAPICVHALASTAPLGVSAGQVQRALHTASTTLRALRAFGFSGWIGDGFLGETAALDIYLDAGLMPAQTFLDAPNPTSALDQVSAFVVAARQPRLDCSHDVGLVRAIVEALGAGMDAGTHPSISAMHSSYLASRIAPCPAAEIAAIDDFQRTPAHALVSTRTGDLHGNLLFPWFLDQRFGDRQLDAVMTAVLATSSQKTEEGFQGYSNEPDVFDTLRKAASDRDMQFQDLLLDFAVGRAFMGDRADGAHLIGTEYLGSLGRVGFEWSVEHKTLPRRLAPLTPVDPTGATYLWLDLGGADPKGAITIVFDWEESHVFKWAVARVSPDGIELGRMISGGVFGYHQSKLSVRDLQGAAGLLIVGVHVGNDDREHPYDPDSGPARQAAYTVTLHDGA